MKFLVQKAKHLKSEVGLEKFGLLLSKTIGDQIKVYYSEEHCYTETIDNYVFFWHGELGCLPDLRLIKHSIESRKPFDWEGRGVLIIIERFTGSIDVYDDIYGTFPVYYSSINDNLYISDSLALAAFKDAEMNLVGIMQFIKYAYTIGSTTFLKDVHRIEANGYIKVEGFTITKGYLTTPWIEDPSIQFQDAVEKVSDILSEETANYKNVQLMFSAGWDSRTIFSLLYHNKIDFSCYSHGEPNSRELAIANDICTAYGVSHFIQPLAEMNLNYNILNSMYDKHGSIMSPHWNKASEKAISEKRLLTGGTFGAILGGHNGIVNSFRGIDKYKVLITYLAGKKIDRLHNESTAINIAYELLKEREPFNSWLFSNDMNKILMDESIVNESNCKLQELLHRYFEEGTRTANALYERFMSEHSGGRYMNLQLINSDSPHRNPYTNYKLVHFVSKIPYTYRVHNKLNKAVIRSLESKLLNYPMAATLVNASNPIIVQEASRAARKIFDRNVQLKTIANNVTKYPFSSLGWNNFDHLRNEEYLRDISSNMKTNLFNKENIIHQPLSDLSSTMYSYFDMLCKAYTVDRTIHSQR